MSLREWLEMADYVAQWPRERPLVTIPVQPLNPKSTTGNLEVMQACVVTFRLFVSFPERFPEARDGAAPLYWGRSADTVLAAMHLIQYLWYKRTGAIEPHHHDGRQPVGMEDMRVLTDDDIRRLQG